MTTKRIVYTRPDGGVSVLIPADVRVAELVAGGMSEAEAVAAIQAADLPAEALNAAVFETTDLPSTRTFRSAWLRIGAGAPFVSMVLARVIWAAYLAAAIQVRIVVLKAREKYWDLAGWPTIADYYATRWAALEALDLTALAARIAAATTEYELANVVPDDLSDAENPPFRRQRTPVALWWVAPAPAPQGPRYIAAVAA